MLRQKKACSLENRPSLWQAQQENKMGRPRKKNAVTNTERYKTYQNKRKEEYKLNETLRKMIARQKIKQNPTENRSSLKKKLQLKENGDYRRSCQLKLVNISSTLDKSKNTQCKLYT